MAGKGRSGQRIEPSFAGKPDRDDDELTIDADDRIVGGSPAKGSGKAREKYPKGRKTARSGRGGVRNRPQRREGLGFIGLIRRLIYWCLVLALWGGIGVAGIVLYYGSRMPSASTWQIPARPPNVKINAMDGTSLANRGATGGEALALEDMSPFIPEAIVAIEDRRFYSHFGVDPIGLARAFTTNLLTGHTVQGGSTLTQQLAKNLFLSPDRTMERKVQEVLLALWLEHTYTKDQILAMYLNRVFFGSNAFGVEAASRRYFNKSARDVNLGEAAMLAGLVKAPSKLSPIRDPAAAHARQQVVLQAMRDQGYVTDADIKTALAAPPTRAKSFWNGAQNYAADMVMDQLPGLIGPIKEDVVVETTIDMAMEAKAEQALGDVLDHDGKKLDASQAALISVEGTGAIRAMVGGRDYAESQYNRAVTAKRQPGSAFKPFVYAAAMEMGLTPTSVRNDAPIKIGNWTPENYEQKYSGVVTLATALAHSLNTIAAQLVMEVGPPNVIKLAHRLGIDSELQDNASIALGTSEVSLLELTSSYAAFMNGGYKATPHVITKVTSASGKVLYTANFSDPPRVLSPSVVTNMNYMMEGVMASGTGKAARIPGWQTAGKSGTTQSFRDALFVGFTNDFTTGVWFGNDDGKSMKKVTGGSLPAKAWKEFMIAAHKGLTPAPLFGGGQVIDGSMPMAQSGGDAGDQSTISGIISGVLGGPTTGNIPPKTPANSPAGTYPPAPVNPAVSARPAAVPQQAPAAIANNDEPVDMPPVGPGADSNPYASQSPTPPADIGESPSDARPRRTTLLDYLMGR
ncbi:MULTISPECIES: transglycosylase domain-containing protein [Rhizobium]|uniref:peptidoglycan glycosyltransferase n=1 Tax=Rhizobium rhododendri TaxID=2506430 RepID=A0ABY8IFD2_9HYPH|nr:MULTISPECIES: transglycosylase domain-containing protein [Rhizobium]MBZ5763010.1 penicillin-binding protein [Rhizobium sp. VS19-DR96]MBZ5768882.1 penicillin-binding protein [Rhizobium sp. VS19-DR129.2]MBZ5776510.1 penicillin-binding protein [Rhizobium sp. VS19-DRK62.2]MBZ5787666.1 penicillin-binding protein [Rhizobium sp. VS19-DR121]MBZ5805161.1 penicillin-binding protein [Rhizobium sp. VS19-DR181]